MIQPGFPDQMRDSAAKLYDAAFGPKLSIAIPDPAKRIAILSQGIQPNFSFAALHKGQVVGLAGFKTSQGSFTGGITIGLLMETLGRMGALRAIIILGLFERKLARGQLLMDGIAVSPEMRGSGIGTNLLQRLIQFARDEGYHAIRLDVIDTNPAARRLYQRIGFVPVETVRFTYLKWLLGFEAATQMEYNLVS